MRSNFILKNSSSWLGEAIFASLPPDNPKSNNEYWGRVNYLPTQKARLGIGPTERETTRMWLGGGSIQLCPWPSGHKPSMQSGFTSGKSKATHIIAIHFIMEFCQELGHRLLAACANLLKAFDLVHCKSLWEILRLSTLITGLLASLHTDTETVVNWYWVENSSRINADQQWLMSRSLTWVC